MSHWRQKARVVLRSISWGAKYSGAKSDVNIFSNIFAHTKFCGIPTCTIIMTGMGMGMTKRKQIPRMNASRAALIGLMDQYLRGLLDPFITLLEVHKLMYFMQVAGQPLKLKFTKYPYGPYAENLRHVLNTLEGHFISGYGDGGDMPGKRLELVPGALEDSNKSLKRSPRTRERFDRVADLVAGFESAFGLELLATVHWVLAHDRPASHEALVQQTYAWNNRKRRFSPRQIGLAADVLAGKGWAESLLSSRVSRSWKRTSNRMSNRGFAKAGEFAQIESIIPALERCRSG